MAVVVMLSFGIFWGLAVGREILEALSMGLLNRLFRRDPVTLLELGEQRLAAGDALKALHIAQDVLKTATPTLEGRARTLETEARDAFTTSALEKALRARDARLPQEAVEWLETALDHCREDVQRQQIEELLVPLRQQAQDQEDGTFDDSDPGPEDADAKRSAAGHGDHEAEDGEFGAYELLLEMLTEDVAPLYESRPAAFQEAYLALSEGQPAEALAILNTLLEQDPGDPVLRLERGRSHLFLGHFEEAVADFEVAWPEFEDEPLDRSGEISVPLLWAEAKMALEEPGVVANRLEQLAEPKANRPRASSLYAQALTDDGQLDKALRFLSRAVEWYSQPSFRLQIGECRLRQGEPERAIDVFEDVIAPSCRTGCERSPLERTAARALIGLYLEGDRDLPRAEQVVELLEMDLRRGTQKKDLETLRLFYQRKGDGERVAKIESFLEKIGDEPGLGSLQPPSGLSTGTKAL